MQNPSPPITTITSLHLRHHLGQVIAQTAIEKRHFRITKAGIPVMVVIPIEDYDNMKAAHATSEQHS